MSEKIVAQTAITVQVVFRNEPGRSFEDHTMVAVPRVGDTLRLYGDSGPFLATVEQVIWDTEDHLRPVSLHVSTGRGRR